MNRPLTFVILVVLCISACKKDHITPLAQFTVSGDSSNLLTIGPYDQYSLINNSTNNNSTNADSFIWDFGDGRTSKDKKTVLYYSKSGTYTVTLNAINRNGSKSVASKNVKVVDPILKEVVITTLNWNSGWGRPTSWPTFTKATNLWVEILKGEPNIIYPTLSNGTFDAPVIYKSRVVSSVDSSVVPFVFDIPQKIVIDIPTLMLDFGYKGCGYCFNIYAQDASGTYLISSNNWSGGSRVYQGSIPNNKFKISTGFLGCSMDFRGTYE